MKSCFGLCVMTAAWVGLAGASEPAGNHKAPENYLKQYMQNNARENVLVLDYMQLNDVMDDMEWRQELVNRLKDITAQEESERE